MSIFIDLRNEVRDLKKIFLEIKNEMAPEFYDPIDYIQIKSNLKPILKFRGVYFSENQFEALSKALGRIGVACDSRTLKRLLLDKARWIELWAMGIQTHYMKLSKIGKWVCSDGNILKSNFTPYKTNKSNSYIYFTDSDYEYNVNRATVVYKYFIDEDIVSDDIFWIDGDFNNCSVSNLKIKEFKRGEFE